MTSLPDYLEDKINCGLAFALGFNMHVTKYTGGNVYQVWESPLTSWYYRDLAVPNFCGGWQHMKMLVKAMERIGYSNFGMMKLAKHHWTASFACNKGPCKDHGNKVCNWHGAHDVFGENPGQAAAFAAIKAIATGTHVFTKRIEKVGCVLTELTTQHDINVDEIAKIVKIIDGHIESVHNRHYPHLKEKAHASDESTVRPS